MIAPFLVALLTSASPQALHHRELAIFPMPCPLLMAAGASSVTPITVGSNTTNGGSTSSTANFFIGYNYQATTSGVVNFIQLLGHPTSSSAINYYVAIYAAASSTTVSGALLGQSAATNGLPAGAWKSIPLLTPVNIVAGNWYFVGVLAQSSMAVGERNTNSARFFSNSYSSGPVATAPTSGLNGAGPAIYATT